MAARAWWRRTGRFIALGTFVVLAAIVPFLTVPVAQSYSVTLRSVPGAAGAFTWTTFPQGAEVRGTWEASPTLEVNFTIQGNGYNLTEIGHSGSFNFTARGVPVPVYNFWLITNRSVSVGVNCDFNAPLWAWPPGEPGAPTNYS